MQLTCAHNYVNTQRYLDVPAAGPLDTRHLFRVRIAANSSRWSLSGVCRPPYGAGTDGILHGIDSTAYQHLQFLIKLHAVDWACSTHAS